MFFLFQKHEVHELHELGSMGKALEMQKSLAQEANSLHFNVTRSELYDSEVIIYDLFCWYGE